MIGRNLKNITNYVIDSNCELWKEVIIMACKKGGKKKGGKKKGCGGGR